MIKTSDISIIIQGPIHESFCADVIERMKTNFIDSQIIFSGWHGDKKEIIPEDVMVVLNHDPGGLQISDNPVAYDSANRQIVSTLGGLRKANRKYAIKIRSDIFLEKTEWLKLFEKYKNYDLNFKFLRSRVIVSSMFCVNPNKIPLPYHPSDWFFFGYTEDLLHIFDIPLLTEENANWFKGKVRNKYAYGWHCRFRSEQHIWTSFIGKHLELNFDHQNDIENDNIEISERIFANNTIIVDSEILGIQSFKYPSYIEADSARGFFSSNYYFFDWIRLYAKYSDRNEIYIRFDLRRWKSNVRWFLSNKAKAAYLILLYSGMLAHSPLKGAMYSVKKILTMLR